MKLLDMSLRKWYRLIAIPVMLCAFGLQAQEAGELNSIESLSASSDNGMLVVRVGLKSSPQGQPASFTINTPPRIAFDFPNTENGLGASVKNFGEGDLRSANIVQAGNRTRLVINLAQMAGYDTRVEGNEVLITLQQKGVGGGAAPVA
ncbi:MAG: AMIN domain-containing protein, partial [Sideroxydans sp.]|nr:AMIN domain-containing protein [Sideroxydans sp.]